MAMERQTVGKVEKKLENEKGGENLVMDFFMSNETEPKL